MKKIEPPKVLVDLYRDLRDRRLLLPFGLLAGALVLVPLALSKSSHPSPPPAVAPSAGKASAAQPAVLTAEVGVRNYNQRLAALKEKDPFKRHFKLPGGNSGGKSAQPPQAGSATSVPPSSSTTSASAPTVSATPSSAGYTPTPGSGSTTTRTVTVPSHPPKPQAYRAVVDLKIGEPTKLEQLNGVKPLTELPHASNPIVALLGATLDRTSATFLVSRDVSSVQGGGGCAPDRSACQLLTMKPGGKAKLTDSFGGKTYVLKVLDIRLQRVELNRNATEHRSSNGGSSSSGPVPGGKRAFSSSLRR